MTCHRRTPSKWHHNLRHAFWRQQNVFLQCSLFFARREGDKSKPDLTLNKHANSTQTPRWPRRLQGPTAAGRAAWEECTTMRGTTRNAIGLQTCLWEIFLAWSKCTVSSQWTICDCGNASTPFAATRDCKATIFSAIFSLCRTKTSSAVIPVMFFSTSLLIEMR